MNKSTAFIIALAPLILLAMMSAPRAGGTSSAQEYDAESWKTLLPESCTAFFDGCNNCRRTAGSAVAACTRKACAVYEKPRCLDEPITEGAVGTTPFDGKLVKFSCDDGKQFRVYYGEYVSGDQRVRLGENEIMLADEQTHTAYRLERARAASGARYSDGSLEFWEHGGEAMLRQEGRNLYQNCVIAG